MKYLLLLLVACGTGTAVENDTADAIVQEARRAVSVEVTPNRANLAPGEQVQLSAQVKGASNRKVTWRANKGRIDVDGLYTAPQQDGVYEVTATADASAKAIGKVRIAVGDVPPDDKSGTDASIDLAHLPRTCHRAGESLMRVTMRVTANEGTIHGRNGEHQIVEGIVTEYKYNEDAGVVDTDEVHVAMNIRSAGNPEGLPHEMDIAVDQVLEIQGVYIPDAKTDSLPMAVLHFTHAPCGYVTIDGQQYH